MPVMHSISSFCSCPGRESRSRALALDPHRMLCPERGTRYSANQNLHTPCTNGSSRLTRSARGTRTIPTTINHTTRRPPPAEAEKRVGLTRLCHGCGNGLSGDHHEYLGRWRVGSPVKRTCFGSWFDGATFSTTCEGGEPDQRTCFGSWLAWATPFTETRRYSDDIYVAPSSNQASR